MSESVGLLEDQKLFHPNGPPLEGVINISGEEGVKVSKFFAVLIVGLEYFLGQIFFFVLDEEVICHKTLLFLLIFEQLR